MRMLPHTPTPGRPRRLASILITAVLLVSIGVPASYYVSGETYDERFAWRMFSGKRAERCAVQVTETRLEGARETRTVLTLTRIIHKAWESGLKRLRPDILQRFFEVRCDDPEVQALTLVRRCRRADGGAKPNDEVHHACASRVVVP